MTENSINKDPIIEIFQSIFNIVDGKILPIINSSDKLNTLINFLTEDSIELKVKLELLIVLRTIFLENKALIHYFVNKYTTMNLNLIECIINIYLKEELDIENQKILENLLNLIIENSSISKSIFEFIYQKISFYYIDDNIKKINENYLIKSLRLLQIFYKDTSKSSQDISNDTKENITNEVAIKYVLLKKKKKKSAGKKEEKEEIKDIQNYLYFNGKDSSFSFSLNKNSINVNSHFPTLENGCTILFWLYIDKELTEHYFNINKDIKVYLIRLIIAGHQIKLLFKNIRTIKLEIDEACSNDIDITNRFAYNNWNNICFILDKKNSKIVINGFESPFSVHLPKNFPLIQPIDTIKLFENFFGRISTILFFSFCLNSQMILYFKSNFKQGFHKNKYLFKFLNTNDEEYFSNSPEYTYYQKYKNSSKSNSNKLFKIKLKEQNIKNLISCFVPFSYDKGENLIDDIFGNFVGILGNYDGVNDYINYSNSLNFIGGIDNLLPFVEMMYLNKDILNANTFYEFLLILEIIFIEHSKNLIEANKNKFFSNMGLFLEKYPSKAFTEKVLEIFLKIGKEAFGLPDNKSNSCDNFVNMILLNEKIFSKFSPENQSKLWERVYQFFVSDYSQMRESLNMSKICLLLRFYDEKKYEEYCCKRHSDLFKNNNINQIHENELKIMNPEMNDKIGKLFDIIQLYIKQFNKEKDVVNLYKLLSLDLSPCLQKKIIETYSNYFNNRNINAKEKVIVCENLLKSSFLEISEYVLSISLLDVRVEVLKLIKLLFQTHSTSIKNYINNNNCTGINNILNNSNTANNNIINLNSLITESPQSNSCTNLSVIYMFIRENLLPKGLMVEIEDNGNDSNIKKTIPLENYFNKNLYEEDKCCLWILLDSWFSTKESQPISSGKKVKTITRLNGPALDFCINFTSNDVPEYYTDTFIKSLISYMVNEHVVNREVIYDNKNLFPWMLETIFYFFNKNNAHKIDTKELIESIQKSSLKLFKEYFSNKKIKEDFINKINYIFEYSYYKKNLFKEDKKQFDEISRITSILFEKLLENSTEDELNKKCQICFDFMLFHKNNEENLVILYNDGYESPLDMYIRKKNIKRKGMAFDSDDEEDSKEDKNKINTPDNFEKYKIKLKKNNDLMPNYVYDGIHFNEEAIKQMQESNKKEKFGTLKEIWNDFNLYDSIIDSYRANIWGIENLCKKVKLEYGGNPLLVCGKLIKLYSETKKYKNILNKDILKCLGIRANINTANNISQTNTINSSLSSKNSISSSKNNVNSKVNILQINLILLSVALDIVMDNDEKIFLEGYFQQFLIYCVLASVNINPSDKNNTKIQSELYDILLFGWTFLQKRNKSIFDKIFNVLIKPIFDEINNENTKKGIKGLFSKKNLFKNTAIVKLFVPEDYYNEAKEDNFDDIDQEDELNNTMMIGFGYATDRRNVFRKGIANEIMYKDDSTLSKKSKKIKYILRKDEPKMIAGKIFDSIITNYKKKRNKERNSSNVKLFISKKHNYDLDKNLADEKMRINSVIKEIIPFFETYITKYSNTYYLQEKRRRNEYKKCKKELFSWRGFWSNRDLFFEHPELLKLKKKNHFTKEMVQPLLTPILDIDYYLPEFKKFDKNKLFNKNNYNYKINLDIDEILKEEMKENENNNNKNIYKKNEFGFNYLESLYKLPYLGIWELYKDYHENNFEKIIQKKKIDNNIPIRDSNVLNLNSDENINTQEKEKETKNDKKTQPIENKYHCCIVKSTHHIRGYIKTEERHIKFTYNNNALDENEDPNFDKDMGSCFGSIFKSHKKDKDKINFQIEYLNIKYMFLRHYFYNESAVEIYTETNKSYFLNFINNKDLLQFINDILHHSFFRKIKTLDYKGKKLLGYESIQMSAKKKSYYISHKVEDWQNYNISTLEYLMWLNIYAGRSYNDLTQYPVFPWILTNYKTEKLNPSNDYRDLNIPMGMMEINEKSEIRKETFIDFYNSLKNELIEANPGFNYQEFLKKGDEYYDNYKYKKSKREKTLSMANPEDNFTPNDANISSLQINQLPYYYGTHYSNPTYISNYLTRTFPFSLTAIEIQGEKFDDPDRIFLSLHKTFESASSLKDDVRELIPEFYILPEIFLNSNNLNLSQDKLDSEGNQIIINDVELPPWSGNKATNFISEMRKNLESNELKINKWVDLIFGNLQRGTGAEENHNIFMAHTYERMVKIDTIEDSDSRNALMRLVEIGVTPFQLFSSDSKQKIEKNIFFNKNNIYSSSKDSFLEESRNLLSLQIKSAKYNTINNNNYQNHKNTSNKGIGQAIFQKIAKIIWLSNNNLRIFTNANYCYNLKYSLSNEIKLEEESNPLEIENNSNRYSSSYLISSIKTPLIIYSNNKYMIKGGFWDGRIELNTLIHGPKEEAYNTCIFSNCGPITCMDMTKNEHLLICGTKLGVILAFEVYDKNIQIKKKIFLHSDEITSISINSTLNMFSSVSKDGYIMLYILPTFELVRSIKIKLNNNKNNINKVYANNVFLSSCPIPVIVIYSSEAKIFKIYSINGLDINEQEETDNSRNIKCYCIYNNIDFQEFLIYGTDDGLVKIRKFPEMNLMNSINPLNSEPIETLTISQDKRYCYVWGKNNQIVLIKEKN